MNVPLAGDRLQCRATRHRQPAREAPQSSWYRLQEGTKNTVDVTRNTLLRCAYQTLLHE